MTKARRPEDIIGEWGVRDVTPPSQREREKLVADSELNPLHGRRLRRRLRNFRSDPDNYIASLGGPLPYMQRLRQIDELTRAHLARLEEAHAECGSDWPQVAARCRCRARGSPGSARTRRPASGAA